MPAASPASLPTSPAVISSSRAASPPFPSCREGRPAGRDRPGRADRLAHLGHLLHQRGEPLVLGHLPLGLLQLRARLQVHIHRLAARPAGQVPLRPVPAVPRLGARAARLAALAPHRVQRPPAEIPHLRDQREQLAAAAFQPRQVTAGEVSHRCLRILSDDITQNSRAACGNQAPSRFSRAPRTARLAPGDTPTGGRLARRSRPALWAPLRLCDGPGDGGRLSARLAGAAITGRRGRGRARPGGGCALQTPRHRRARRWPRSPAVRSRPAG